MIVRLPKLGVSTAHAGELVRGAASVYHGLVRTSRFNEEFDCFLNNRSFCCLSGVCFGFASPLTLVNFTECVFSGAWRQSQKECMRDFITARLPHTGLGDPPTWMKAKDLMCVCSQGCGPVVQQGRWFNTCADR